MNIFEALTSDRHDDGLRHARYPTATRTLCGQDALETRRRGQPARPTCKVCWRATLVLHAIDSSAPHHWNVRLSERQRVALRREGATAGQRVEVAA